MLVAGFASYDGTQIGYRLAGQGPRLVCVPGGPGRAADYLGDLGGLDRTRQLLLLDLRGVGASADAAESATLRVDRMVEDLEALRVHLGVDRVDLMAHSAGCVLATLYAAAYPQRLSRLILITPGLAAMGIHASEIDMAARLATREAEPWYPDAQAAWQCMVSGDLSLESFRRSRPLFYGQWDAIAQAHATVGVADRYMPARQGYFADVDIDVRATRAALTTVTAPVLLYGGELDPLVTPAMLHEAAELFPHAVVTIQPGVGHFPWIEAPMRFATSVGAFLEQRQS